MCPKVTRNQKHRLRSLRLFHVYMCIPDFLEIDPWVLLSSFDLKISPDGNQQVACYQWLRLLVFWFAKRIQTVQS